MDSMQTMDLAEFARHHIVLVSLEAGRSILQTSSGDKNLSRKNAAPPKQPQAKPRNRLRISWKTAIKKVMVMTRWQAAQKKTGYKASQWFVEQKKRLAEQQLGQLGNAVFARILEWIAHLNASHMAAVAREEVREREEDSREHKEKQGLAEGSKTTIEGKQVEPQVESEVPIIDETNGYGAPCLLSYGTHVEDQVEQRLSQLGFNDHLEAPFSADRVARVCGRWATEKGLGYLVMGIDDGQSDSDDDLTYEAEGSDDEIETQQLADRPPTGRTGSRRNSRPSSRVRRRSRSRSADRPDTSTTRESLDDSDDEEVDAEGENNALFQSALRRRERAQAIKQAAMEAAEAARLAEEEAAVKKAERKLRRKALKHPDVALAVELFLHCTDLPRHQQGGWGIKHLAIVSAKCAKIFHDQQAEGDWHAGAAEMRARAEWLKISKGHDVVIGTRLIDGMANIVDTFCPCDITPAGFRNSLFALLASICVRPTPEDPHVRMRWRPDVDIELDEFRRNLFEARETGAIAPWVLTVVENGRQDDAARRLQKVLKARFDRVVRSVKVVQHLFPMVKANVRARELRDARDEEIRRRIAVRARLARIQWGAGWMQLQGRYARISQQEQAQRSARLLGDERAMQEAQLKAITSLPRVRAQTANTPYTTVLDNSRRRASKPSTAPDSLRRPTPGNGLPLIHSIP
eukprot:INCI16301.4.p1 GENE.INCI16301.4~~INCI16301.4.p1  ORF type:complete len:689 (+),score=118.24 INCI16301.4:69-2135(+)